MRVPPYCVQNCKARCGPLARFRFHPDMARLLRTPSIWNREVERRAFARFRFHPHASTMALDDLFAHGQPDPCARIFVPGVQELEDHEEPVEMPRDYADAVVAHGEDPRSVLPARPDVHLGRAFASEFDGVADEVLEHLRVYG
jgi:hypothetical protein